MDMTEFAQNNKILEVMTGSHLYGTATETSDYDYIGIFMPPEDAIFGLASVSEVNLGTESKDASGKNTADAIDCKCFEFRNILRLMLQNNPNCLEPLYAPAGAITFVNDIGRELLANADLFPYRGALGRFIGYAHGQKHLMIVKDEHFLALREAALELPKLHDKLPIDEAIHKVPNIIKQVTVDRHGKAVTTQRRYTIGDLNFPEGVTMHYVIAKIDERLAKIGNRSSLVLQHGFDTKFAGHLIRLLLELEELLATGRLVFPLRDATLLKEIRAGQHPCDWILALADDIEARCEKVKETSPLPDKARFNEVQEFCMQTMKKHLRMKGII